MKTKLLTLAAAAGALLMCVDGENWWIPLFGMTILAVSVLAVRSENEN